MASPLLTSCVQAEIEEAQEVVKKLLTEAKKGVIADPTSALSQAGQ